jgi:hypothetical protein
MDYVFHDFTTKALDYGDQIDGILLDFSKAFDKVPHNRLLMKLDHYGVRNNTLSWIQDFLSDRTQTVVLEKSSKIPSIWSPESSAFAKSWIVRTRWVSHDLLLRKPCCSSERMLVLSRWVQRDNTSTHVYIPSIH